MYYQAGSLPYDAPAGDVTLASYEAGADAYLQQSPPPGKRVRAYLDQLAELVGAGTVLELGSGPGWDAAYLETKGPRVVRTDAVNAFVDLLRAARDKVYVWLRDAILSGDIEPGRFLDEQWCRASSACREHLCGRRSTD